MRHQTARIAYSGLGLLFFCFLSFCSQKPQPKETLYKFFAGVIQRDSTVITDCLDLEHTATEAQLAAIGVDSIPSSTAARQNLLVHELAAGRVNQRWREHRIVVGESEVRGDTATVEVSFFHRETGRQYYNKMELVFSDGRWKIVSFKLL